MLDIQLKNSNKAQSQRIHAKKRALERYGLTLNRDDLEAIVDKIQRGKASFLERQSHRVCVYALIVKGRTVKVVYDKIRKTIVTFLPLQPLVNPI